MSLIGILEDAEIGGPKDDEVGTSVGVEVETSAEVEVLAEVTKMVGREIGKNKNVRRRKTTDLVKCIIFLKTESRIEKIKNIIVLISI